MRETAPPVPTIGELVPGGPGWIWLYCASAACTHKSPAWLKTFIDRWGADESSDRIRRSMVCTKCGHNGVLTYHPSWVGPPHNWQPFPGSEDDANLGSPIGAGHSHG